MCPCCGKAFKKKRSIQKYCSQSCSTKVNNILYPRKHLVSFKRPKTKKVEIPCRCGGKKYKRANQCRSCKDVESLEHRGLRTLSQFKTTKGPSENVRIREHAKDILRAAKITKACRLCGYTKYVEACHIKSISSFSDDSLLKEINSLSNLIYLCPNHHKELDNNLLSEKQLNIVLKGS